MTEKCCRWKSTSGLDGKMHFANNLRTNKRIFEIQTAYDQVWSKWWQTNFVTENVLPVWTGTELFAHIIRSNRRIFEILTAYVQVWSKWWWKNVVAENLLPVSTGKGFLLITWEPIDGFLKFKRHMLRFDRSDDQKCCRWKSTSGLDGKRLFAHILRTNRRIFEIQTAFA